MKIIYNNDLSLTAKEIINLYGKKYTYITMHIMAALMANGIFQLFKTTEEGKEYRKVTLGTAKAMLSLNLKGYERVTISGKKLLKISKMSEFLRLMNELPNDVK